MPETPANEDGGHLSKMFVESDADDIVRAINKESTDITETNNLIGLIRDLLLKADVASFSHCSMSANGVAHSLARMAAGFFISSGDPSLSSVEIESFCVGSFVPS